MSDPNLPDLSNNKDIDRSTKKHVYTCLCTCVNMYLSMCTYIYIYICICVYIYEYVYIYTYAPIQTYYIALLQPLYQLRTQILWGLPGISDEERPRSGQPGQLPGSGYGVFLGVHRPVTVLRLGCCPKGSMY